MQSSKIVKFVEFSFQVLVLSMCLNALVVFCEAGIQLTFQMEAK